MARLTPGNYIAIAAATLALGASVALAALRIGGLSTFIITGASMEPTLPLGSMIFVQPVSPQSVAVGDIVTYTINGHTRTHRIIGANEDGTYVTKGDANKAADTERISFPTKAGVVRAYVPVLGHVMNAWRRNALLGAVGLQLACIVIIVVSQQPRRRVAAALQATRRGDRKVAIALLRGAVAAAPLDRIAHRRLAAALLSAGDTAGAREEYARFIVAAERARNGGLAQQELLYARALFA